MPSNEALAAQQEAQHAALVRHKEGLTAAMQELSTLRSVVKALESTVEQLQKERNMLLRELRNAKNTERDLLAQISALTVTCERLTETVQQSGVDGAHRVAQIEALRRDQESRLRAEIDRLTVQLINTQNTNTARSIPWSKISAVEGHPAQVLRDVVASDWKREERALRTMAIDPQTDFGVESSAEDTLPTLLTARVPSAAGGKPDENEDSKLWMAALRRVHQVLLERRRLLHIENDDPVEYLLRTRHEMVSEIVQLHLELRRAAGIATELHQRVEMLSAAARRDRSDGVNPANMVEGHVELLNAAIADMDFSCCRVKRICFTDIDRTFHNIPQEDTMRSLTQRADTAVSVR
jgi:hypothetical protein